MRNFKIPKTGEGAVNWSWSTDKLRSAPNLAISQVSILLKTRTIYKQDTQLLRVQLW